MTLFVYICRRRATWVACLRTIRRCTLRYALETERIEGWLLEGRLQETGARARSGVMSNPNLVCGPPRNRGKGRVAS
ncbi:hypothetical protein E1J61_33075 [Cupriavidus sp. L7L]|nr:hypothetical protein E1J61_33075 [Cupriavidus sp. L7L]